MSFKKILFLLSALLLTSTLQGQRNPYGLKIVADRVEYLQSVATDPSRELVKISDFCPPVILDMKYATADNFLHEKIYSRPEAYLRRPAAEALCAIQAVLEKEGLGLKIFDAYRPYAVTLVFYEKVKDTAFVAAPWKGSRHNRGCAVDLTLVDLKSGRELPMPTGFDDFTEKANPNYTKLPEQVIKNRDLLISVMSRFGFTVISSEWWHYDYRGWENFDLMDISFEDLSGN